MARKFIKGTFELDKDVTDIVAYEEEKKEKLLEIADWCNNSCVAINAGTADDNTYLCEYKIVGMTMAQCNETLRDLKKRLKDCFPYVKMIWQGNGDCL